MFIIYCVVDMAKFAFTLNTQTHARIPWHLWKSLSSDVSLGRDLVTVLQLSVVTIPVRRVWSGHSKGESKVVATR